MLLIRCLNLFTARTNTILSHLPCWHRSGRLFQAPIRTLLLTDNRVSWTTFGQWRRWPMIQTPNTFWGPEKWGATGGARTTPQESRHLAYQRRVKRWGPSRCSLGGPTRTWKLCISGDPFRGYSEDIFGGTGYGHGTWSPYGPESGIHLWMWHTGIMPRSYGSYWWRRQDSYHLWRILGRCKLPTSRPIPTNALQPPQSWTASTAFTGCRHHRKNLATRNSPMHIGIGPKQDDQWMLLKADVTKAHRRVKILAPEWRYQVAKLGDEWWINKVGTYGMASAQLYWGRLASALLRLLYHVYPMVDWGFVFVDDFCWLLRKSLAGPLTSAILLFLVAFGCPLSWKKTAIGLSNTWLGFIMTPDLQLVRMAPTKHELVMAVLDKMVDNQTFTKQELDSALGRLQWATNCCPLTKPFLQAFSQWKSAVKSSGRPTKLLRGFAHLLHCLFEKDYHHPTPYAPQSSWWGASDASASDSGEAYVGGWISNHPNPEKHQVWWFHYQVKEDQHPWAFKDRKPKRRIAALEMLGTLFLTMYLCRKSSGGPVLLPLASDNQGNIYGLLNDYTRKMPTAGLLMEIMFQLTATSCSLMPSHVKRDFNQWADDLTHPSFEGFDSSLELMVAPLLSEFKIFPWILQHLDAQGDLPGPEPVEPAAPAPKLKKRRKC